MKQRKQVKAWFEEHGKFLGLGSHWDDLSERMQGGFMEMYAAAQGNGDAQQTQEQEGGSEPPPKPPGDEEENGG